MYIRNIAGDVVCFTYRLSDMHQKPKSPNDRRYIEMSLENLSLEFKGPNTHAHINTQAHTKSLLKKSTKKYNPYIIRVPGRTYPIKGALLFNSAVSFN